MLKLDGLLHDMRVVGAGAGRGARPLFFALVERKFPKTPTCHSSHRFLGFLAGSVFAATALAQPGHVDETASATQTTRVAMMKKKSVSPFHTASLPIRAKDYYESIWGVDNLLVRRTASGNLIRFSYRVTDSRACQRSRR